MTGLPPIDPTTGLLPPGRHKCSWAELEERFVRQGPFPRHRRKRFTALLLWASCLDELFPHSTLWINGSFVTYKSDPPFDIDVLAKVRPRDWAAHLELVDAETAATEAWARGDQRGYPPKTPQTIRLAGLMTHQGLSLNLPKLQPFGGLVDAFITPANNTDMIANFHRDWSRRLEDGKPKGFVEVKSDGR